MQEVNGKYFKIRIPCPDGEIGCAVCHHALVEKDAFYQIHDRYYDNYGNKPDARVVAQIYRQLPRDIKDLAKQWGWDDTEVRETVSKWMSERIIIFL